MTGDQHFALHFVEFSADLLEQAIKGRFDFDLARIEQSIAPDPHHGLVGFFNHRHQSLADLRLQKRAQVLRDLREAGVRLDGGGRRGDAAAPHHRHGIAPDAAQRGEDRIGSIVQQPVKDGVGQQQQGRRHRRHHPQRDVAAQGVTLIDHAAPVR